MNRPLLENETHWRREFISPERYFETLIPGWEAFSLKLIPNGRVDCAFAARWTLNFYWCTGMNPIWCGSSLQGKTFPVTFTLRMFRFCRCIRCWTRMNPIGRGNSSLLTGTFVCTVLPNSVEWLSALGNEPHWVREFIPAMECRRCTKMKPIERGNSFRQRKNNLHRCFHVWMNFWWVWLSELHWMRTFISTLALGWEARYSLQRMNPIECGNSSRFMFLGHLKIYSNRDSDHVFEFFCTMLTGCREWIPFCISIAWEWILRLTLEFISDSWLEYHTFCS